ncbi:hypothetical protein BKA56DRAFT_309224 [Ilyonectria sp. MPI-CAGE-AT-0026]|nr:hypothetical protein BKA56DRAFT_309224 [Ilyonectria sp. MPI-CAGE-AT-0026]
MFRNKREAKRTVIVIAVKPFLQVTGPLFSSVYGAYFVKQLEFINPFITTCVDSGTQILAVTISMALVYKLGQRNAIFLGSLIQGAALFSMGGLGTVSKPIVAVKSAVEAMIPAMVFGFGTGWVPISHTIFAEIPSMRLRDDLLNSTSAGIGRPPRGDYSRVSSYFRSR